MRDGMNPIRGEKIEHKIPPQIPVVVVVTHLPNNEGYHLSRWEIVTKSLQMARKNAGMKHWLVVWDNGSSDAFREWLQDFAPDQLILSKNIGVMNTMHRVMGMYNDCIVSWCNDDLIYYPDWLKKQVNLLKAMPETTATVTGCLTRYYMGKADEWTQMWANRNAKVEFEQLPIQWDIQHGESIGKDKRTTLSLYDGRAFPKVTYKGRAAYIGGNHCQMTGYASKLYPFTFSTKNYMVPLFQTFDTNINKNRMLRFHTPERLTRHIGNILTDEDRKEINELVEI